MASTSKIVIGLLVATAGVFGITKGISYYNRVKNATNNMQIGFAFVRVHGLIGNGITKLTNPVLQVIFQLQIKNLSDFVIKATNIVATVQQNINGQWSQIAITDNFFQFNSAPGTSTNVTIPINFAGLTTLASIANINTRKYRVLVTYRINNNTLSFTQDLPLQQYLRGSIDALKAGLNLKGLGNNTLQLAG